MAVTGKDIAELLDVLELYVDRQEITPMLAALRSTTAATLNEGLAETLWRLLNLAVERNA